MRLDLGDQALDLRRRLLRALGQLADLGRNDGEPTAVLTGAGRLDRGVEGQQVGLLTQLVDEGQDSPDLTDLLPKRTELVAIASDCAGDPPMAETESEQRSDPRSVSASVSWPSPQPCGGIGDLRCRRGELLNGCGRLGHSCRLLGGRSSLLRRRRPKLAGRLANRSHSPAPGPRVPADASKLRRSLRESRHPLVPEVDGEGDVEVSRRRPRQCLREVVHTSV